MIRYEDVVQQRDGDVVAGATVTIYDTGTTDLVTIYSDDGITPKDNPTTTDADGVYFFWAAAGTYDIRVQVGSVVKTTPAVSLAVGTAASGEVVFPAAIIEKAVAVAALDVDASLGNYFSKTVSGPTTLTFSNEAAVASFSLEITNSGGAQTLTWPASVRWPGDTIPTPTTGVDLYVFAYNGAVWRGALAASYVS